MKPSKYRTPAERFDCQTSRTDTGCWEWTGAPNSGGTYGRMRLNGRRYLAHVASYLLHVGPIPEGHELHHRCRSTRCVNPDHLVPKRRRDHKKEHWVTHCSHGHPLIPGSFSVRFRRGCSERICKECARERLRLYRKKHPEMWRAQKEREKAKRLASKLAP